MHPLIDEKLQHKARAYEKKRDVYNGIMLFITGSYFSLVYISGFSQRISGTVTSFRLPFALAVYFFFLLLPITALIFPLSYFKDFRLEKKFDLTAQSFQSWFGDELKSLAVGTLLGFPVLLLLFYLFRYSPRHWWLFSVAGLFLFEILISVIFPVVLLPVFYKQKHIEDEELLRKLDALFQRAHIKIYGIFSINLSSKTKKENAALAGLWKTRRVLLGDTLLQNRSREEIEAVLAHEIGHHIQKHMLKLTLVNLVTSFLLFYALNALMTRFSGFPNNLPSTFTLFPLFILFSGVLSVPMRVGLNAYSRLKEKEADRTALDLTGKKEAFIRVMAGLANKNLSVAYPKPYKVVLSYSHPPVGKRIQFAQTYVANSMANTKLVP